jgi:hypothetical protein
MEFSEVQSERVPVQLANGAIAYVEVSQTGHQDVSFDLKPFHQVTQALEGIIDALSGTLHRTLPDKACVKFGLEVGIEAGQLTAIIVKGASRANLEITLEWNRTQ